MADVVIDGNLKASVSTLASGGNTMRAIALPKGAISQGFYVVISGGLNSKNWVKISDTLTVADVMKANITAKITQGSAVYVIGNATICFKRLNSTGCEFQFEIYNHGSWTKTNKCWLKDGDDGLYYRIGYSSGSNDGYYFKPSAVGFPVDGDVSSSLKSGSASYGLYDLTLYR